MTYEKMKALYKELGGIQSALIDEALAFSSKRSVDEDMSPGERTVVGAIKAVLQARELLGDYKDDSDRYCVRDRAFLESL